MHRPALLFALAALVLTGCDDTSRSEPDPDTTDDVLDLLEDAAPDSAPVDSDTGDATPSDTAEVDGDAPDQDTLDTDTTDVDAGSCGDGRLDAGELCDTGIGSGEGACPTAATCVPADSCQTVELTGTDCQQQCIPSTITACTNGDGCCAAGCDASNDDDCTAVCGNGKREPGELCDDGNGTATPQFPCPTSCAPQSACETVALTGSDCQIQCEASPLTACTAGDGCCPDGCAFPADDDCSPDCGNGTLDADEACDTAIASGQPGACPTAATCVPANACETAQLSGTSCDATCQRTAIETCTNGDGCCASGCDASNDNDCTAVCGNGIEEPGELCDTGIGSGAGACPTVASCQPSGTCDTAQLMGTGCQQTCAIGTIVACSSGDGCCPATCDHTQDDDCSPMGGSALVINEFMVDPTSDEAIELYNGTAAAIALDGWSIRHTDTSGTDTFPINSGLSVPAGGFLALANSDMSGPAGSRYTSRGAVLELVEPGGTAVDAVGYGILGDAPSPLYLHSTSRIVDGVDTDDDALDFNTTSDPDTLGAANSVAAVALGTTDVVVNEFFIHLGSFTASWVEVTNIGSATVDLRDWILIYGRDEHIFGDALTSGPMLAPGARLVLQDSDFFSFAPSDSGNLYLFQPGWVRVQQVTYGTPADGPVPALGGGSVGLFPDGDVAAYRGLELATQGYCVMSPSEGGANTMCTP